MAYAQKLPSYITPEEYLLLEERSFTKHEYLDGVIYDWQGGVPSAMAGGTVDHSTVILNIAISLRNQLRGAACKVVSSDVRLNRSETKAFFYPDVMVTCSATDRSRNDAFAEPTLIIEVSSPSTELFDRGEKFGVYRTVASLESYVLISLDRRSVEVLQRQKGWAAPPEANAPLVDDEATVSFGALGLQMTVGNIFEGVATGFRS